MNTTHHFGNCDNFTIDYTPTRFHMSLDSYGGAVGHPANVDRWLSLGAGAIDARIGDIWDIGPEGEDRIVAAMKLPLLARAVYVADCDGPLEDQAELCNA